MKKHILLIGVIILGLISCREDIKIKPAEGEQLLGVSGSITNELKKHELTLSRTMGFYEEGDQEMVSDASIFVHDNNDTIWYEETEESGVYQMVTEYAGKENHTYFLSIDLPEHEGGGHYFSQSTMETGIETIDSLVIKQYKIADVEINGVLGLYPYFMSIADENAYYMIKVAVNDSIINGDKITNCYIFSLLGMSGWYFNGTMMAMMAGEIPVWDFYDGDSQGANQANNCIFHGDTIRMDLSVIPAGFASYVSSITASNGSNPMLGTPSNVSTNIGPDGKAVGFFYTATTTSKTIIY